MKLATFIDPVRLEGRRLGIVRSSGMVDVRAAACALNRPVPAASVKAALSTGQATRDALEALADAAEKRGLVRPIEDLKLLPPIPDPSKLFCVGKNSREHRRELVEHGMLKETPQEPTGFVKLVDTMVGQDAEVERPDGITTFDYEPELVLVIGKRAHRVRKSEAESYVAGITVFNDLTAREIQKREVASGTRFWTAKNMPGFSPLGPYVATLDEVADPFDLWLTCTVNGEERLRESTSQYIFRTGDVLEHFSRYMPFEAGDFIAMGAPKGTAMSKPNADELYLKPGDRMEIGLEGLMSLRTTIVAPQS
jgi:2-keto-4-pentenoate hydratase/2-oxohepta-3-ene-1,7-dioic acid hydratase in catechol pathway